MAQAHIVDHVRDGRVKTAEAHEIMMEKNGRIRSKMMWTRFSLKNHLIFRQTGHDAGMNSVAACYDLSTFMGRPALQFVTMPPACSTIGISA